MSEEVLTKEDLWLFRIELLNDIKQLLKPAIQEQKEDWLKSAEVCKILKMSAGSLQNLRISGKLRPVKINGTWRYKRSEVASLFTVKR